MMSIILCPGGEAVYVYTLDSIFPAVITTIIWTVTIILFAINLRDYLKHKQTPKSILISFIFVIATAILNVLTFIFFVHKEWVYTSGATVEPLRDIGQVGISGFIIVILMIATLYVYKNIT